MAFGMKAPKQPGPEFTGDRIPEGYDVAQMQNFTPEAMQLYNQSFSHVGPNSFTSKLASGDQSAFAQMEAPALRQFSGMQGNIASRFSGMGQGGRHSNGFQLEQNSAASDFAQRLQGQRMDYQNQAVRDLMSMSHTLMNEKPYERSIYQKPEEKGFNWGGAAGAGVGAVGGFFLGGPMGAFTGAQAGYGIGSNVSGYGGAGGGGGGGGFQSSPNWSPGWGGGSGQQDLGGGYDQEFRMNPQAMGY